MLARGVGPIRTKSTVATPVLALALVVVLTLIGLFVIGTCRGRDLSPLAGEWRCETERLSLRADGKLTRSVLLRPDEITALSRSKWGTETRSWRRRGDTMYVCSSEGDPAYEHWIPARWRLSADGQTLTLSDSRWGGGYGFVRDGVSKEYRRVER